MISLLYDYENFSLGRRHDNYLFVGVLVFFVKSQCAVLYSYILFSTWQMYFSSPVFLRKPRELEYKYGGSSIYSTQTRSLCKSSENVF